LPEWNSKVPKVLWKEVLYTKNRLIFLAVFYFAKYYLQQSTSVFLKYGIELIIEYAGRK
jgi:hypothetical protein